MSDTDFKGFSVPETISEEWREYISNLPSPALFQTPEPDDLEGWRKFHDRGEEDMIKANLGLLEEMDVQWKESEINQIPVLTLLPKDYKESTSIIIYLHGGGYTMLSAKSRSATAALMAESTGLKVIAVDYTTAPFAKWDKIHDEVLQVIKGLLSEGYSMNDIVLFGDSAGGGLAASVTLHLRDIGMGLPAALVLWSPWADITETGDTYHTLKYSEPQFLYDVTLSNCRDAYASPQDWKNPYVSPVHGDFDKGFPPTLIQGGTKEILLSGFIRLYQAIDQSGHEVKLDLYEGMVHVFQSKLPDSPESKVAIDKSGDFIDTHLGQ
ncbi:MAG: alpha/beta hydrolase [Cyclobacteriaceae bacterium]